jgi:hypothetical protein
MSADSHGNTPAAWTAVAVALAGFVVGSIALMLDPVSMPIFWVGVALGVGSLLVFAVLAKLGLHGGSSANSAAGVRSGDH